MSAKRPMDPRFLSFQEREYIKRRIQENKIRLGGALSIPKNKRTGSEGISPRRMGRYVQFMNGDISEDKGLIRMQIARDEAIIKNGSPAPVNKRQRQVLEKKAASHREWLQKNMCPRSLFYTDRKSPDFDRATRACFREHHPDFKKKASEYKNLMRRLDPDRPEASNLETIRPKS